MLQRSDWVLKFTVHITHLNNVTITVKVLPYGVVQDAQTFFTI